MKRLLFAVLIAAPAAAEPVYNPPSGDVCTYAASSVRNKIMRVTVSKPGEPGRVLHQAALPYVRCEVEMTPDAPVATGAAILHFGSASGGIAARMVSGPSSFVDAELRYAGGFGIGSGVTHLGGVPFQQAFSAFVVPNASAYDIAAGRSRPLGDVNVIFESASVPPSSRVH